VFALSSIITPFFFGAVVGGIASGRVPTGGNGDALRSWLNPTSVLGGVLAVLVCAYLAAVFLTAAARAELDAPMQLWFSRRALAAGLAAGAVSIAGIFVLHHDAPRLFHQLSRPGLPLLIASVLCGAATLELLRREKYGAARALAALTVATVVCGWGVAQYPYLLGTHLSIAQAASPRPTLWVLLGVAFVAAVVIAPSLALLYRLQERGRLGSHG
jgi:cytochrome d ubiquinol oxidase subunit II